jgi:hypothetical protein
LNFSNKTYRPCYIIFLFVIYFTCGSLNISAQNVVNDTVTQPLIIVTDSISVKDIRTALKDSIKKPDPTKAIWYSALFPGLGQVYNRRYWKLPIVGAGIVAISYAISWNNKYYVAYTNAYRDITDDNPNTESYKKLLPNSSSNYSQSNLTNILKNRQQIYRRNRDLSIIGAVGVYLFCILDAYVDAQLYDFDISPDLTLQPNLDLYGTGGSKGIEMSLSFRF